MEPDSNIEKNLGIELADYAGGELLQLWKSGNQQAASILVDRYALRLVALVAKRLNRRFRDSVDPEDVVQSALGSFFEAAYQSKIHVRDSTSLWRLLATFTRRKLARSIERQTADKRGAGFDRVPLEAAEQIRFGEDPDMQAIRDLRRSVDAEIPEELRGVLDGLFAGLSQQEIADWLGINGRTVRRRVVRIRKIFKSLLRGPEPTGCTEFSSTSLPRIDYGEFVLGKLTAAGGFGKVYRASMQSDGSTVAVKFLRKSFWSNAQAKLSFLREIEAASRIDHPAVNRYLGWGKSPHGGPYVLSTWIDGRTLNHFLKVSPTRFVIYLQQLCEALSVVHASSVIHGDVTPNNILVDGADRIVLTDFGFSQYRGTGEGTPPIAGEIDGLLGGTIGFAAPEQISVAFGAIGPRTDLYAVGGLAFWYLAGKAPHHADRTNRSFADTISPTNVDLTGLDCPSEAARSIRDVAEAALCKSTAHRPSCASELLRLLRT